MRKILVTIILFAACSLAQGQEPSVGIPQGGGINLPASAKSKPTPRGTSLPANCEVGELFFKTDATAGQNQYACTATDTWTLLGDGGGAGGGDNITVNGSAAADANFKDSAQVAFALDGVPTPDDITATIVGNSIGPAEIDETAQYAFSHASSTFVGSTFTGALVGNADTATNASSATTAATANAGDSATAFFASGTIEDARLSANVSLLGQTIGNGELEAGAVDSAKLATANKTIAKTINIFDPTTGDTNQVQIYWPAAVTMARIVCSVDTGTVSINFDERAEATPNTAGTDTLATALVCDTDSQSTASFSDSGIAADVPHNLQITATSGSPTVVRIHAKATIN